MKRTFFALMAMTTIIFTSCVKNPEPFQKADDSIYKGKLFINEVNGWPSDDPDKNFELYNATNEDISLKDFYLVYTEDRETWRGRDADVLPAKGYKLIQGARTDYPGFATGLSNRNPGVYLTFYDEEGKLIDHYEKMPDLRGTDLEFRCHMRIPDAGKWYYIPTTMATPGAKNLDTPPQGALEMPPMEKGLKIESISPSSASFPAPEVAVTVKALVSDANVISSVVIKWKKGADDQPDIVMNKVENEYVGTIPGQPAGTVVTWYVLATNDKGRTASTEPTTITWETPAADYTKLVINEVNGCDGEKWFEIYNTGDVEINLKGVTALYSNVEPASYNTTWTGAESQTIAVKGYFSTKGSTLGTGLSARNANVRLQLRAPDGTVLDTYEKLKDITGNEYAAINVKSHARIPDGTGTWYYTNNSLGTPGATNGTSTDGYVKFGDEDGEVQGGEPLEHKLLILQVYGPNSSAAGASHPFVELYNTTKEAINLNGITLYYADGTRGTGITEDGEWKKIALSGSIPAEGSFLILGPHTSSGARLQIENNYGDINDPDFVLSNRAYKIAIIRGSATITMQNPFDTDGNGTKVEGYIDMVGAANDYTNATNPDNIFGFETAPARCSASEAVRRKNLIDTDNNQGPTNDNPEYTGDFIAARYATGGLSDDQVEAQKPRNSKVGSWNPFAK